ncbi:hypothetical protein [Pedobacter sp. MC2016-24]|uniref:hypothetical protein n=1 Tax=Pedobacter sp. MC2016-24 TaxID=2780090 RepID=UPI00188059C3|nr:hypothetical protein [Pedobacter sp. MC2016-24]MBE9599471.1 hypothetical protein [Pedobacter sp. MC2016-24]
MKLYIYPIFTALFFLSSCINAQEPVYNKKNSIKPQSVRSIDDVYAELDFGQVIKHKKIQGEFVSIETNEATGKYVSKLVSKESMPSLKYVSYAEDKKDVFVFGKQTFNLKNKMDPSSLSAYWLYSYGRNYLCIIGKGQSASGSGVQVSYFALLELENSRKAKSCQEFVSRFGNINSLVDYNKNGDIAYLRIVNGKEMGQYLLTINDIKTNQQLGKRSLLLKYELNDKFIVLQNNAN